MLIKKLKGYEIPSSEITSHSQYLNRRSFLKSLGLVSAGALLAACRPDPPPGYLDAQGQAAAATAAPTALPGEPTATAVPMLMDELGDPANTFEAITNYNNYYEFTTDKQMVARVAEGFPTSPWEVEVGGLVRNPDIYDIDALRNDFDHEERIYRMRCVEGWSMVIPWNGFPLSKLLEKVEPTSDAKYVRFQTVEDREHMPGLSSPWYEWPYIEGLRMDEAMNDLTLMVTGMYGEDLLPQNGAPIRLVTPWKYGFKGVKSIVKIDLVAEQPTSLWMAAAPNEYGFYANVNPEVSHPRWSQATERRIGESSRRPTLMFNGYEDQVAHLYAGMDLRQNY